MILYFTGTGNSRYVARKIAEKTGDELVSINRILKEKKPSQGLSSETPYVFVLPTYAWRIPRIIDAFIRRYKFGGSNKVYFVLTCGEDTAKAIEYLKDLCKVKSWELIGFAEVIMPDFYIALTSKIDRPQADKIICQSKDRITQVGELINDGKPFNILTPSGVAGKLKSGVENIAFYKFFIKADGFHTSVKCNGCGQCARTCPLNNITMEHRKPVWGKQCTHCMACIQGCPQSAIEYKNKTQGKPRCYIGENEEI